MFARLKKLNGHATDPASLEKAVAKLLEDLAAERLAITAFQERRRQALLDENFAAADKLFAQTEEAKTRIESLQAQEPLLRGQLAAAKDAARQRGIDDALAAIAAEFDTVSKQLLELDAGFQRLHAMRSEAMRFGSGAEVTIPVFGLALLLGEGHAAPWVEERRRELEARLAARFRKGITVTQPRPAQPREQRVSARASLQHAVTVAASSTIEPLNSPASKGRRAPDDDGTLLPGHSRVVVLRGGFEGPDGLQSPVGRRLQLPRDLAIGAAKSGALEILDEPSTVPAAQRAALAGAIEILAGVSQK